MKLNLNLTLFFIATLLLAFNTFMIIDFFMFRSIVPTLIDGNNYTVYVDYFIKTGTNVLVLILLFKQIKREKS